MRAIEARRRVPVAQDELYTRLADLRGHWELAGRWVEPLELRPDGGTVRIRGPFGIRRTIHTSLTEARAPTCVAGEARLGRTLAAIRWHLEDAGDGTLVTLRADIRRCGPGDRALLALGGGRWLRGRFAATLDGLG